MRNIELNEKDALIVVDVQDDFCPGGALAVERVFIAGLAADYCVQFTTEHAIERGFDTYVFSDATEAIADKQEALDTLRGKGATLVETNIVKTPAGRLA
ncbi:MAG: hypothetical protein MAG453_00918 [Calditrichaeota bacterium]|nr:hypothetical protein [Calditrichota bacterium]